MNLSSAEIRSRLPQAPPFVLIDRVEGAQEGRGVAFKRFDPAEPWFAWHFPGDPVVPGILLLECMAQAAGLVHGADAGEGAPPLRLLAEAARFRVRRPVRPGEEIAIEVRRTHALGGPVRFETVARIGGAPVAEAELTLAP
jgi:3-hydroxyacyl-[acyl-carrier-protein] dehydratase